MPSREPELPETEDRRCPYCRYQRIAGDGHVTVAQGMIIVMVSASRGARCARASVAPATGPRGAAMGACGRWRDHARDAAIAGDLPVLWEEGGGQAPDNRLYVTYALV
jgi:hypothetical protein